MKWYVVGLASTDPVILDNKLQLGYWINKNWLAGCGVIAREKFGKDTTNTLTGDTKGYSFFMRHDLFKGFYAWGELERQVNRSFFGSEGTANLPQEWQETYLLGLGVSF